MRYILIIYILLLSSCRVSRSVVKDASTSSDSTSVAARVASSTADSVAVTSHEQHTIVIDTIAAHVYVCETEFDTTGNVRRRRDIILDYARGTEMQTADSSHSYSSARLEDVDSSFLLREHHYASDTHESKDFDVNNALLFVAIILTCIFLVILKRLCDRHG